MTNFWKKYQKKSSSFGFTLIELLVVIAIIGILTSILGGNYLASRARARDAQRKSNLREIQSALELYFNDHSRYPTATVVGVGNSRILNISWGRAAFDDSAAGKATTVYMAVLAGDPASPGNQYYYEVSSDGTKYRLFATLETATDVAAATTYSGRICSEASASTFCNYGVSSASTTMTQTWP